MCSATVSGKPANVPSFNVTSGKWGCNVDSDVATAFNCGAGQLLRFNTTSQNFYCSNDDDALGSAVASCSPAGVPRYTANGGLSCGAVSDADTLRDLAASGCTNGYTVKYLAGAWTCAQDKSLFLTSGCANGQTVRFTSGSWSCAKENDTLRDLISICNSVSGDAAFVNNNGDWDCLATPIIDLANPSSTVLLTATIPAPQGVRTPLTGFVGLGGLPWVIPYPGTIKAWSVTGYEKGPVTVSLAVDDQVVDQLSTSVTTPFFISDTLSYDFNTAKIGVSVTHSAPMDINLEIVIFVEVTLN